MKEAKELAKRLAGMQSKTGEITGAESSITNSRGENLIIETTSLATTAWLYIDPSEFGE